MSEFYDAIYEDGVFKPVAPLSLPEHTPVRVEVAAPADSSAGSSTGPPEEDAETLAKRKESLQQLWAELDRFQPPKESYEVDAACLEERQAAWKNLLKDLRADPKALGPNDGWSAIDHDDLLYGQKSGPT